MELTGLGRTELAAGRYQRAREAFERSLELEETPEALEGLGHAARWLVDPEVARSARERAYALYRDRGDRAKAAGVALWLGEDATNRLRRRRRRRWLVRPLAHAARGSRRLVGVRGWLAVREGDRALLEDGDATVARARGVNGRSRSGAFTTTRTSSTPGARSAASLPSLSLGDVAEGMRELEAAFDLVDRRRAPGATDAGRVWCCLIFACERVRDVQRASEWCATVRRRAEELQNRQFRLLPAPTRGC